MRKCWSNRSCRAIKRSYPLFCLRVIIKSHVLREETESEILPQRQRKNDMKLDDSTYSNFVFYYDCFYNNMEIDNLIEGADILRSEIH
jgi:hypothetical protein